MTQRAYQPSSGPPGAAVPASEPPGADPTPTIARLVDLLGHDLRGSLTLVSGVLQTLGKPEHTPEDPEMARLVDAAAGGARRMGRLLDDFAAAIGVLSGDTELRARPLDPASALRRALAEDDDLAPVVGVRSPEETPQAVVDPIHLGRIVACLARSELGRGATRITVDVAVGSERLVVVVVGDGGGIPPEAARRLTATGAATAGLGLAETLAAGLASAMGGRLTAAPVPGDGTSFRLVLPRRAGSA